MCLCQVVPHTNCSCAVRNPVLLRLRHVLLVYSATASSTVTAQKSAPFAWLVLGSAEVQLAWVLTSAHSCVSSGLLTARLQPKMQPSCQETSLQAVMTSSLARAACRRC